MSQTAIREIKSIYSGRLKSTNPMTVPSDIKTLKTSNINSNKHTFFNGVISKLNISTKN